MSGSNSLPALGTLNRALTHLTFASFPSLNVVPANMSKRYALLNFEGVFVEQLDVAVGTVPSPEPYVMGVVSFDLLKTQSLAASWLAQLQSSGTLGTMVVYNDTTTFPAVTLSTTVVRGFDPDAMDGMNPVIKVTARGVFYINNSMWS